MVELVLASPLVCGSERAMICNDAAGVLGDVREARGDLARLRLERGRLARAALAGPVLAAPAF